MSSSMSSSFVSWSFGRASAHLDHVGRLRPLLPLHDLELDLVALGERLESRSLDRAVVHEHVGATFTRDEAETLRVVEPLDRTVDSCHARIPLPEWTGRGKFYAPSRRAYRLA